MSQHSKIIDYIKRHGSITIAEIQTHPMYGGLGINNGSARMSELDKEYHFDKERVSFINSEGHKSSYIRYSLPAVMQDG